MSGRRSTESLSAPARVALFGVALVASFAIGAGVGAVVPELRSGPPASPVVDTSVTAPAAEHGTGHATTVTHEPGGSGS